MSIHQHPAKEPLAPPPGPLWGEIAPENERSAAVRFVLADRVVSFPVGELRRWEHTAGNPETLVVAAGVELITIEGQHLAAIRAALDGAKLREIRVTPQKPATRASPVVRRISIEPA
jgi:hypothetical protein